MQAAVVVAVVGAAAALIGGLLTALATRRVEVLRLRASLLEKADERKLETLDRFMLAVNAWLDQLVFMDDQRIDRRYPEEYSSALEQLNDLVSARDEAYRRLVLLASDSLYEWLADVYNPLEYKLKATYGRQLRWGEEVADESRDVRRSFSRSLREDLVRQFRPEVVVLRDPTHAQHLRSPAWAWLPRSPRKQ
jgi:hypothetical protein